MPSPSLKTRDGEASTKPSLLVAVDLVEAARIWGGQLFAYSRTKLTQYQTTLDESIPIADDTIPQSGGLHASLETFGIKVEPAHKSGVGSGVDLIEQDVDQHSRDGYVGP